MATKDTLTTARRLRIIRDGLAKLERELENAQQEDPSKKALWRWLAEVEQTLRGDGQHVLH